MGRRDRRKRVDRQIAGNVERALLERPLGAGAATGLLLIVLSVVFVPLGLAYLIVAGLVYYGIFAVVLGARGDLMAYIGGAYWIGALGLMFVLFRRVYRWLARRNRFIAGATEIGFGGATPAIDMPAASPPIVAASATAETPSLAELDARLAPGEAAAREP